jgi:hydrogenase maturation protease
MESIIVVGVGDPYRRDDGVGPAVVAKLRERDLSEAVLATSLGRTEELIKLWDGADLAIVVDAMRASPAHPGRVHRLAVQPGSAERVRAAGSHGMDLGAAVELAREQGRLPNRLVIYAVEAADVAYGVGLSPAVETAVEHLADEVTLVVWAARRARPAALR